MAINAEKIAAWREAHPGKRLTTKTLREVLGIEDFRGANFRGANLRGANLRGATLRDANLWDANLWDADLWGADLRDADLWGADLRGADLWDADLRGADLWGGLRVDGLRSGQATLVPTPDGWHLRVGCWTGTVDDLRTLITTDDDWPEAHGEECARRRPQLAALIAMCEAHTVMHADLIPALAERWGTTDGETR